MILCLDVGNSQIFGGVFLGDRIVFRFRKTSRAGSSSDELGVFLRSVLRENGINSREIREIALCTVVPDVLHSLRNACRKYFQINPFELRPGVKTGLRIQYSNPTEVGSDRIANAIGAVSLLGKQNFIIVDLGTATTFCAIRKGRDYLGGVILAGLRISMEALESKTARLPAVEILPVSGVLGRSTVESIQSGLYWGAVGAIREISVRLKGECFGDEPMVMIGTGGFSSLFEREKIFDRVEPDLVLWGLKTALAYNRDDKV